MKIFKFQLGFKFGVNLFHESLLEKFNLEEKQNLFEEEKDLHVGEIIITEWFNFNKYKYIKKQSVIIFSNTEITLLFFYA